MAGQMIRILDGNTFVVCDERGDIEALATEPTGLFSFDTRFLSTWVLTINGQKLNPLSVDDLHYFESRFFLVPGTGTVYIDAKLSVIRQRAVGYGFHEELTMLNHSTSRSTSTSGSTPGAISPTCSRSRTRSRSSARTRRAVEDGRLAPRVRTGDLPARDAKSRRRRPPSIDERGMTFKVRIEPHGSWTTDLDVVTKRTPGRAGRTRDRSIGRGRKQARPNMERSLDRWLADAPRLESDWEPLRIDLSAVPGRPRGLAVLAARRRRQEPAGCRPAVVHDDVRPRQHLHQPPVAAVRAGARRRRRCAALGDWQGSRRDDFRDEDPGRILHEMRYGEMAAFEERPHTPYYGSVDATPLYVVLLDEYERWTGDRKLVRDLEYEARAAPQLDRRVRRPDGQRLHLVQAPERADRPREPGLEGLLELDRLQRRPAAGLPARDVRAAGLRLRREDARRPAGPAGLEGP